MKTYILLLFFFIATCTVTAQTKEKIAIYMVGDEFMANQDPSCMNPQRGWGQMLPSFFMLSNVEVHNYASCQTDIVQYVENKWKSTLSHVQQGNYVFIQFVDNEDVTNDMYVHNVKQMIVEIKKKGAIPVLFTPIVLHNFKNGLFQDIDTEFLKTLKHIAESEKILLIDVYRLTKRWVLNVGEEISKQWCLYIKPGINPKYPQGVYDGSRMNIKGARGVARLVVEEIAENISELEPYVCYYDYVVAKDGSGDFYTVQEAIDAVPLSRQVPTDILVRCGEYKEQIFIPAEKNKIHLVGEDPLKTKIENSYNRNSPNSLREVVGTMGCATMLVYGLDFSAEKISIVNTSDDGFAITLLTGADRMAFRKCRIYGNNGTIFNRTKNDKIYFEDCYIEGTQDYIIGKSVVVFNRCEIHSKENGSITAVSTPEYRSTGYLFYRCHLTGKQGVRVYLGQTSRAFGQVAYVECKMDDVICQEGWLNIDKELLTEMRTKFVEINNEGEGSDLSKRVDWMAKPSRKTEYTPEFYLGGEVEIFSANNHF